MIPGLKWAWPAGPGSFLGVHSAGRGSGQGEKPRKAALATERRRSRRDPPLLGAASADWLQGRPGYRKWPLPVARDAEATAAGPGAALRARGG